MKVVGRKYNAEFKVHMEVLESKRQDLLNICKEIILNTKFDEDSKIKEIITRLRVMLEERLVQAGHSSVVKRIQSYYSQTGKYAEKISGLDFYEFILDLDNNYDERKDDLKNKLSQIKNEIFLKENLSIIYVGEEGSYNQNENMIREFINSLPVSIDKEYQEYDFKPQALNEGILTQSDVQYVGLGANLRKLGYDYSGSVQVLQHILEYDYLWNHVRVKGGAYGSKILVGMPGDFLFGSYRDPNLEETYNNYKNTYKYLKSFSTYENNPASFTPGYISMQSPYGAKHYATTEPQETFESFVYNI